MDGEAFETPEAAEDTFYRAFAATDLGSMAGVWIGGDEARCIHPGGGLLSGSRAVLESWRQIFAGAAAPRVRYRRLHRTKATDLSIHLVEERIGRADADDAGLTRVLATNVYRQTPSGWRLILHHATLPLVEERRPKDAAAAARRLH